MSVKKTACKELEERLAELHHKNKLAIAGTCAERSGRMHDLERLIRERTAELTNAISTLHEEVLRRIEAEHSLRLMAARLTMAERKERQRLALVLHDDLQQILAAALFQISVLNRSSEKGIKQTTSALSSLLRQAIHATRLLASELSPPMLHDADLAPALEWLKNWMRKNQGLKVELTIAAGVAFEKEETRILLFESIRELLFNVVKHANTDTAYVGIDGADGNILIKIRDEGCGFDASAIGDKAENAGLGLVSIRERLSLLGGSVQIETSPGKGSKVSLVVPAQ